jgi:O-methyltransferase
MGLTDRLSELLASERLLERLVHALPDKKTRKTLLARMQAVSKNVPCPHEESHVLSFIVPLLEMDPETEGVIVEAGCFRGGSTAKLSLVASLLGRRLVVFDSFSGLPENDEVHDTSILGHSISGWFEQGKFRGSLDEVRANVERFGEPDAVEYVPGWFEDTMPSFDRTVCAAYVDVDLAASTRACLKFLYPKLSPGGVFVSQDGDFPLVIEVFSDDSFWERDVGCPRPAIQGLGSSKILTIALPGS